MKTKAFMFMMFISLAAAALSLNAFAFETWHTASGKAYEVYLSFKVGQEGKDSGFYIVSYKSEKDLNDKFGLLLEYYDLLTHFYYFHAPEKLRDDKLSIITVEAFGKLPASEKEKAPSRRYTKRLSELKTIVQNHKNTDWNRLRAFQSFNQKQYEKAISLFKKTKNTVPRDYVQTANAFILLGKRDKALKELKSGVKKYPKDATLLNNLAMTTMLQGTYILEGKYEYDPGKIKEAKKILSEAMKLDENNWITASNMAVLEATAKNFKAAEELYLKALKLSGENAELSYRIAGFYHGQKKFQQAQLHYENALQKLKETRSPASQRQIKMIQERLKLAKEKKAP